MFDFYKMGFDMEYLTKEELQEATKWKCMTPKEYKIITGEDYTGEIVGETKPIQQ